MSLENEEGDFQVPGTIGEWEVGRKLGRGSQGLVFTLRNRITNTLAVAKILIKKDFLQSRMSLTNTEDVKKVRLVIEREIVLMKLVDHPNILRLYDVWETKRQLFLILELVNGGELFELQQSISPMPAEQALHYFQQILAGVSYLHQSQIVHRDLKLENILRDTDETVKICDFGFATWHAKGDPLLRTACGSPYYASPEILSLVPYDGALADIWSLGVILFALLVGKMPFEGQTTSDTMLKIRMNQCQIPNTIDPVAADLLKRIFVKDPRKRITMPEILVHPYILSQPPPPMPGIPAYPPAMHDIDRPVNSLEDVDPEIFKNMKIIWPKTDPRVIQARLLSSKPCWEKYMYQMLANYRQRALANCDDGVEDAHNESEPAVGKEHRRGDLTGDEGDIEGEVEEEETDQERYEPVYRGGIRLVRHDASMRDWILNSPDLQPSLLPPSNSSQSRIESDYEHIPSSRPKAPTPNRALNRTGESSYGAFPPRRTNADVRQAPVLVTSTRVESIKPIITLSEPTAASFAESSGAPRTAGPNVLLPDMQDPIANQLLHQFVEYINSKGLESPLNLSAFQAIYSPPTPVSDFDDTPPLSPQERRILPLKVTKKEASDKVANIGLGLPPSHRRAPARSYSHNKENTPFQKEASLPRRTRSRVGPAEPEFLTPGKENDKRSKNGTKNHVRIIEPPKPSAQVDRETTKLKKKKHFSIDHINPVSERPDKLRSTSASPSTPVSTSPVPDWLSAVFRFKQNPYNLRSIKGAVETREECQRLLREFGVTTQLIHAESGPGVLKCWLEEVRDVAGLMTATKSVRFRVECHPTTNSPHAVSGYICVLTLIQEQGASSSFKMIWNMLRRQWDFDTPRTPLFLTVKPAPSPRTGPVFTDAGGYEVE